MFPNSNSISILFLLSQAQSNSSLLHIASVGGMLGLASESSLPTLAPSEDQLSGKNAIRPATLNDELQLFFRLGEVTFAEEKE